MLVFFGQSERGRHIAGSAVGCRMSIAFDRRDTIIYCTRLSGIDLDVFIDRST